MVQHNTGISNAYAAISIAFKRMAGKKVIANSGIYVAGNFLQKALVFLLIPMYTRYLTASDYGISGLAISLEGVLILLFGFGIQSSVARYYYEFKGDQERLKQYITANFLFLFFVVGLLTLSLHLGGHILWEQFTSGQIPYSPFIQYVLWSAYAGILIQLSTIIYQTQQNARSFVIAQIAMITLNLGSTILFVVVFGLGVKGQLLGRLLSSAVVAGVLSVILLKQWFDVRIKLIDIQNSLAFGFPLVFHGLFGWAVGSIDRFLLEPRIPLSELGRYNLGYQIGGVMMILLFSINLAWMPYYYSIMDRDANATKRKVRLVSEFYVAILGGICLAGLLFSREILFVISAPQFQGAVVYVPLILFSSLFNGYYFLVSTPIFYYKKTNWIPIITGASAMLNVGLNLWWIPRLGALGSAWATLWSFVVMFGIAYILSQRLFPIKYPMWQFGVLNGIIAAGSLLIMYGTVNSSWIYTSLRIIILMLFLFLANIWLIKPNLKTLMSPRVGTVES